MFCVASRERSDESMIELFLLTAIWIFELSKLVVMTIKYKNYLIRSPCDFLNDDLNAPSSPILQEQTWSFSPSSGMGQGKTVIWSILAQLVAVIVEDTVANPRRRTKNGRNIFQVLKMVLCRIFPTEKTNGHYEIPDGSELREGKWNNFQKL